MENSISAGCRDTVTSSHLVCDSCHGVTFASELELFDHKLTWEHQVQLNAKREENRRKQISPPVHSCWQFKGQSSSTSQTKNSKKIHKKQKIKHKQLFSKKSFHSREPSSFKPPRTTHSNIHLHLATPHCSAVTDFSKDIPVLNLTSGHHQNNESHHHSAKKRSCSSVNSLDSTVSSLSELKSRFENKTTSINIPTTTVSNCKAINSDVKLTSTNTVSLSMTVQSNKSIFYSTPSSSTSVSVPLPPMTSTPKTHAVTSQHKQGNAMRPTIKKKVLTPPKRQKSVDVSSKTAGTMKSNVPARVRSMICEALKSSLCATFTSPSVPAVRLPDIPIVGDMSSTLTEQSSGLKDQNGIETLKSSMGSSEHINLSADNSPSNALNLTVNHSAASAVNQYRTDRATLTLLQPNVLKQLSGLSQLCSHNSLSNDISNNIMSVERTDMRASSMESNSSCTKSRKSSSVSAEMPEKKLTIDSNPSTGKSSTLPSEKPNGMKVTFSTNSCDIPTTSMSTLFGEKPMKLQVTTVSTQPSSSLKSISSNPQTKVRVNHEPLDEYSGPIEITISPTSSGYLTTSRVLTTDPLPSTTLATTTTLSPSGHRPMMFGDIQHISPTAQHTLEGINPQESAKSTSTGKLNAVKISKDSATKKTKITLNKQSRTHKGSHKSDQSTRNSVLNSRCTKPPQTKSGHKRQLSLDSDGISAAKKKFRLNEELPNDNSFLTALEQLREQDKKTQDELITLRRSRMAVDALERKHRDKYNELKQQNESKRKHIEELKTKLEELQHELSSAIADKLSVQKALSDQGEIMKRTKEEQGQLVHKEQELMQMYRDILKQKEELFNQSSCLASSSLQSNLAPTESSTSKQTDITENDKPPSPKMDPKTSTPLSTSKNSLPPPDIGYSTTVADAETERALSNFHSGDSNLASCPILSTVKTSENSVSAISHRKSSACTLSADTDGVSAVSTAAGLSLASEDTGHNLPISTSNSIVIDSSMTSVMSVGHSRASGSMVTVDSEEDPTTSLDNNVVYTSHKDSILCLKIHGGHLFSSSADRSVHMYNVNTGELLLPLPSYHERAISSIAVYECRSTVYLMTGSSDKTVQMYNIKRGKKVAMFNVGEQVTSVAVTGDLLFIALMSGGVKVVDLSVKKEFLGLQKLHSARISSMYIHNHLLIIGSFDKTVSVWDIKEAAREKSNGSAPEDFKLVKRLLYAPNSPLCIMVYDSHLMVGCGDKLYVHSIEDWRCVHQLDHTLQVTCVGVMGSVLVTGSFDGMIRCFDIKSFQLLQVYCFETKIYCMCTAKSQIIVGLDNGSLRSVYLNLTTFHACKWRNCGLKFGILEHLTTHHLPEHINLKEKLPTQCQWEGCTQLVNPSEMLVHLESHTHGN